MITDPAVRSIRVAATLTERFGDILRSTRGEVSVSDLELKIGEAQQIYPEIWGHLDDARKALAARGTEAAAYDAIRATETPGTLGVTRVDVETHHASTLAVLLDTDADYQKKTATFNVEGFRKAKQAAKELMAAMPEVDWGELARAEARQLAMAGSLTAGSYRKTLIWVAAIAALFAVAIGAWKLIDGAATRQREEDRVVALEKARADRAELFRPKIEKLEAELAAQPCNMRISRILYRAYLDAGRSDDARAFRERHKAACRRDRAPAAEPAEPAPESAEPTPAD